MPTKSLPPSNRPLPSLLDFMPADGKKSKKGKKGKRRSGSSDADTASNDSRALTERAEDEEKLDTIITAPAAEFSKLHLGCDQVKE